MQTTVSVDIGAAVEGLRDLEKTQLPFAIAKTITGCAQDGQAATREKEAQVFKLRNSWTQDQTKIRPADKRGDAGGKITAAVYTDTANRATGAPDYVLPQEDGGEKVPFGGHSHIAVPTRYLRQIAPGVIPAELRPRALLSVVSGRYSTRTRKGQIAIKAQVLGKGTYFFIVPLKSGAKAIMARSSGDARDAALPLYILITEAHIQKSGLQMVDTVSKAASDNFARRWEENWRQIRLQGIRL